MEAADVVRFTYAYDDNLEPVPKSISPNTPRMGAIELKCRMVRMRIIASTERRAAREKEWVSCFFLFCFFLTPLFFFLRQTLLIKFSTLTTNVRVRERREAEQATEQRVPLSYSPALRQMVIGGGRDCKELGAREPMTAHKDRIGSERETMREERNMEISVWEAVGGRCLRVYAADLRKNCGGGGYNFLRLFGLVPRAFCFVLRGERLCICKSTSEHLN